MKYSRFYKCLLLASVSLFSYSTKVEAGKFDDFIDWMNGRATIKAAHLTSPKNPNNSQKFKDEAKNFIEEMNFFDEDVQGLALNRGRFIVNQDADHPDLLRSLTVWDTEKNLMYTKEESLGKRGKRIIYFDHQADVPYWKKNGEWHVTAPYILGYHKEHYTNRRALEERLDTLFQQRLKTYSSESYEITLQRDKSFTIKKATGVIFKKTLETNITSDTCDAHHFFLNRELERYTDYLYEGEENPSKLKSLGLLTMILGANITDGMHRIKLGSRSQAVEENQEDVSCNQLSLSPSWVESLSEPALFLALTTSSPKLLPFYLFMKWSQSLGIDAAQPNKGKPSNKNGKPNGNPNKAPSSNIRADGGHGGTIQKFPTSMTLGGRSHPIDNTGWGSHVSQIQSMSNGQHSKANIGQALNQIRDKGGKSSQAGVVGGKHVLYHASAGNKNTNDGCTIFYINPENPTIIGIGQHKSPNSYTMYWKDPQYNIAGHEQGAKVWNLDKMQRHDEL